MTAQPLNGSKLSAYSVCWLTLYQTHRHTEPLHACTLQCAYDNVTIIHCVLQCVLWLLTLQIKTQTMQTALALVLCVLHTVFQTLSVSSVVFRHNDVNTVHHRVFPQCSTVNTCNCVSAVYNTPVKHRDVSSTCVVLALVAGRQNCQPQPDSQQQQLGLFLSSSQCQQILHHCKYGLRDAFQCMSMHCAA